MCYIYIQYDETSKQNFFFCANRNKHIDFDDDNMQHNTATLSTVSVGYSAHP